MKLHPSMALLALAFACSTPAPAAAPDKAALTEVDKIFADWQLAAHAPGLVYGVVADGQAGRGARPRRPGHSVGRAGHPDSLFRIASMSKAFTALAILKLRDEGKLSLDAPAELYVPELKGWAYPTSDSPKITVRNLLTHNAGFVEDNPWGDRQQVLTEPEFTAMLKSGVPFSRAPGVAMEYSNLGYATLGRIISNVSGTRYQDYIRREIMLPLGMTSTTYDIFASPKARRSIGYRWQDNRWVREPDMKDGAFGAMGGVETSASDYAKWVAFLLSAWPARDGPDAGPVRRSSVREIVTGSNFVEAEMRSAGGRRRALPPGGCLWHGLERDRRLRPRPRRRARWRLSRLWLLRHAAAGQGGRPVRFFEQDLRRSVASHVAGGAGAAQAGCADRPGRLPSRLALPAPMTRHARCGACSRHHRRAARQQRAHGP